MFVNWRYLTVFFICYIGFKNYHVKIAILNLTYWRIGKTFYVNYATATFPVDFTNCLYIKLVLVTMLYADPIGQHVCNNLVT